MNYKDNEIFDKIRPTAAEIITIRKERKCKIQVAKSIAEKANLIKYIEGIKSIEEMRQCLLYLAVKMMEEI